MSCLRRLWLGQIACLVIGLVSFLTGSTTAAELFVADRANERIVSFDERTGAFLRVVTSEGLAQPSGMTFGTDGFLYVSNSAGYPGGDASVVKVDPVTGATTPFITNVAGAGGIAYHQASNTFFVSEFLNFDGDEVFRYDASGALMQTLGTGSAPTGRAGMTFDNAGNLYVSEFNIAGVGSVLKYAAPTGAPTGPYSTTATTFASGADVTLAIPAPAAGFNGLTFDSHGDLLVASLIGQALVKFNVAGGQVQSGIPFGAPLPYPSDVLIGQDGNILVSGLGNDNPGDPFYGPETFPGSITRFNAIMFGSAPFLVGDANHNAVVDGADLAVWQATYGTPFNQMANADLDGDFDTDGRDFLLWQRGFGNAGVAGPFQATAMARYVPAAEIAPVPEPAAATLLLLVAAVFAVRRP